MSRTACTSSLAHAARSVASLAAICAALFQFVANPARAESTGVTFDRGAIFSSCSGSTSLRCDYPIFFSFTSDIEKLGWWPPLIPADISASLPVQLISGLTTKISLEGEEGCAYPQLWETIRILRAQGAAASETKLVGVWLSAAFASCFTVINDPEQIALLIQNGEIPGYVACRPDVQGIPICGLTFSQIQSEVSHENRARVTRLSISSLDLEEADQLLNAFDRVVARVPPEADQYVFDILHWLQGIASRGVSIDDIP